MNCVLMLVRSSWAISRPPKPRVLSSLAISTWRVKPSIMRSVDRSSPAGFIGYTARSATDAAATASFIAPVVSPLSEADVVIDPPIEDPSVRNTSDLRRPPTSRTALAMRPIAS